MSVGNRTGANRFSAAPTRYRSPKQSIVAIPCPDCHAPVGENCISANGITNQKSHRSRIRLATRRMNELRAREPASDTPVMLLVHGARLHAILPDSTGTYCGILKPNIRTIYKHGHIKERTWIDVRCAACRQAASE